MIRLNNVTILNYHANSRHCLINQSCQKVRCVIRFSHSNEIDVAKNKTKVKTEGFPHLASRVQFYPFTPSILQSWLCSTNEESCLMVNATGLKTASMAKSACTCTLAIATNNKSAHKDTAYCAPVFFRKHFI